MPNSPSSDLLAKLNTARQELFDLGGRNPLINFRMQKTRGVWLSGGNPQHIVDQLVKNKQDLFFAAETQNPDDSDNGSPVWTLAAPYTDAHLRRRLQHSFYTAQTVWQEQGINVLYLALGMLNWREDGAADFSRAPLVLIPVTLERTRTLARYFVRWTEAEIEANESLAYKLREEFGLRLPDAPNFIEHQTADYFAEVESELKTQATWSIDREAAVLGFFSFNRLLLFSDLDISKWPAAHNPVNHPILKHLLVADGGASINITSSNPKHSRHGELDYRRSHLIFDADSTQIAAIESVGRGQTLVIQGPPGTGKSQTITNLIAQAIGEGKSVLFVAEKMAALDVVRQRLANVGLGPAVLELHNHNSSRAQVIDDLRATLTLGEPKSDGQFSDLEELVTLRQSLNAHSRAMNDPIGQSGLSPYDLFGRILAAPTGEETAAPPAGIAFWDEPAVNKVVHLLGEVDGWLDTHGSAAAHPLAGSRIKTTAQEILDRFKQHAQTAVSAFQKAFRSGDRLAENLKMTGPPTLEQLRALIDFAGRLADAPYLIGVSVEDPRWLTAEAQLTEALTAGERVAYIREVYDSVLITDAWSQPVLALRGPLITARERFFARFSRATRQAEQTLTGLCRSQPPPAIDDRIALVDAILEVQRLSKQVDQLFPVLADLFGERWAGWASNWGELNQAGLWLMSFHRDVQEGLLPPGLSEFLNEGLTYDQRAELAPLVADAGRALKRFDAALEAACRVSRMDPAVLDRLTGAELGQRLGRWAAEPHLLKEWAALNQLIDRLASVHLHAAAAWIDSWRLGHLPLAQKFEKVWLQALLIRAFEERSLLRDFDGEAHQASIDRFRELDIAFLRQNRYRLAYRHWENIPPQSDHGRLGTLWKEIKKKRGHMPLRELVKATGPVIQKIKPVFMMSPLSVAKVLPPGQIEFDLVIFDEASQVRPVDAFGAILRARQTVVVGDSRQLPPTTFFEKVVDTGLGTENDDDFEFDSYEDLAAMPESILDLFVARGIPQAMLRWHYRSRHESLIGLSNRDFYDGRLVLFPSPDHGRREVGLHLHHNPATVYERGGSRTNPLEAAQLVDSILQHARECPDLTLGVVTFSLPQRHAIDEALQARLAGEPDVLPFFEAHVHEPFFVKNLENVQGDERDVILISVGYGRDAVGKVILNFGPLNAAGGERRLNVLITRARRRCELFTNLTADDIDLSRTQSFGIRSLKNYLAYAATGRLADYGGYDRSRPDPFVGVVRNALARGGLDVEQRVGLGGIEVDVAVRHPKDPDRYLAGIEIDGRDYARATSATERDRLQQAVLRLMGWRLTRIWAADWFQDGERAGQSLQRKLGFINGGAPAEEVDLAPPIETIERYAGRPKKPEKISPYPYVPHANRYSLIDGDAWEMVDRILREDIIRESPLSKAEVERRMRLLLPEEKKDAWVFGTGIGSFLEKISQDPDIQKRGDFFWHASMKEAPVRRRSRCPLFLRRWELIAREEQAAAVQFIVNLSLGIHPNELVDALIVTLGLVSNHKNHIFPKIRDLLSGMIRNGEIAYQDRFIFPADQLPAQQRGRENTEKREKVALKFWHEMVPPTASKPERGSDIPPELAGSVVPYKIAPEPFDLSKLDHWRLHGPTATFHSAVAFWYDRERDLYVGAEPRRPADFDPQLLTRRFWETWPESLRTGDIYASLIFDPAAAEFKTNQLFFIERETAACYRLTQIEGETGFFIVATINPFFNSIGNNSKEQIISLLPFDPQTGLITPPERVIHRHGRNFYTLAISDGILPRPDDWDTCRVNADVENPLRNHLAKFVETLVQAEGPIARSVLRERFMNTSSLTGVPFGDRKHLFLSGFSTGMNSGHIFERNNFIFHKESPVTIRNRSDLKTYPFLRRLESVSDAEILQTLALIRQNSPALSLEKLPARVVRVLGVTQNTKLRRDRIIELATDGRTPQNSKTKSAAQSEENPQGQFVTHYPVSEEFVPFDQRPGWQLINSEFVSDNLYTFDWQTRTFGSPLEIGRDNLTVQYRKPESIRPGRLAGRLRYRPSQGEFILHDLYYIVNQPAELDNPPTAYRLLLTTQNDQALWVTQIVHPTSYRRRSGKIKAVGTVRAVDFDPPTRRFSGREKNVAVEQSRRNKQPFPGDEIVHSKVSFSVSQNILIEMNGADRRFILETLNHFGPIRVRDIERVETSKITRDQFLAFLRRVTDEMSTLQNDGEFFWIDTRSIKIRTRAHLRYDSPMRKLENVSKIELTLAIDYLLKKKPDLPREEIPKAVFELMGLRILTAKRRQRILTIVDAVEG